MATIEFNCGGNSKQALLALLAARKVAFNAYSINLFMSEDFVVSNASEAVEVAIVTPLSLGFHQGCTFNELAQAAASHGLGFCSLEVAAYLRLGYTEQPEDESYLTVASPPPSDSVSPNGFYLRSYGGHTWLRGYSASPDYIFAADMKFAFMANS